jgi:hypothetical protein
MTAISKYFDSIDIIKRENIMRIEIIISNDLIRLKIRFTTRIPISSVWILSRITDVT